MENQSPSTKQGCVCNNSVNDDVLYEQLDEIIALHKGKEGALIPVLQSAQSLFGYLPEAALKQISRRLHKPYSEVAGVVGFYSYFSTVAKGKHTVRVCLGTACYVRGGKDVLKALMDHLKINVSETTADRNFSLEVGRCFGACGLAPVIMVDDTVYQKVKPAKISEILKPYTE